MAILGVAEIIFGVDDLEKCTRFWNDFGLSPLHADADHSVFEVASGSRVTVRRRGDAALPPQYFEWPGIRETIWGVDTADSLNELVADLSRDRKVRRLRPPARIGQLSRYSALGCALFRGRSRRLQHLGRSGGPTR